MSSSDSDSSSDNDYYTDDSIGVIPPEDAGMEGNLRRMAIDIAVNAVTTILLENPNVPEARLRERITYRLKIGERACKLARGSLRRWTVEDIHTLALANMPPAPEDLEEDPEENVEPEEEDPEENIVFEEEDLDADLIPGDGIVDEPIGWEDLDDEDAIVDDFYDDHQTWTFPPYDWPSDADD